MEGSRMFNIGPNFDMDVFVKRLSETYAAKGYTVNAVKIGPAYSVSFEKDLGGINTILGMGEGIKANITQTQETVNITFSDAEWTSKIIACVVGWFLCWIPIITGIIGFLRQTDLPKSISNDANLIIASL